MGRRINLVLYLSFKCNYSCPCCIIKKSECSESYPKKSEHDWTEWVEIINEFPPANVCITGGEPLLFPGLFKLIHELAKKHRVFLTTNLYAVPNELLNCKTKMGISASFHPYMTDIESFTKRIHKLKEHGFNPAVEYVAYPPLFDELPEIKTFFEKEVGVTVNIDPYISPDHRYNAAEIETLKRLDLRSRKFGFDFDGYGVSKYCDAGSKHFVIVPNGDVYTCQAGLLYVISPLHKNFSSPKEKFYLGNLFDGSFKPLVNPKMCFLPCSEGCDLDGAHVR